MAAKKPTKVTAKATPKGQKVGTKINKVGGALGKVGAKKGQDLGGERLEMVMDEQRVAMPTSRALWWLVFAYVWRSFFVVIPLMVLAFMMPYILHQAGFKFDALVVGLYFAGSLVVGVVIGVLLLGWLVWSRRMLGGIRLLLQPRVKRNWVLVMLGFWWSVAWRVWVLMFLVMILMNFFGFLIGLSVGFSTAVARQVDTSQLKLILDNAMIIVQAFLQVVSLIVSVTVVPYLMWRWVLRKRVFGWGMIELREVDKQI